MAEHDHGKCPNCATDLNGGLIWQTLKDRGESDAGADRIAAMYGATRTNGQWGRQIAIYSRELDRTVAYQCPDCTHEWPRERHQGGGRG